MIRRNDSVKFEDLGVRLEKKTPVECEDTKKIS